jgi:late competence protein required for DNA uptake (superfamily II DNA/RNA helicase)
MPQLTKMPPPDLRRQAAFFTGRAYCRTCLFLGSRQGPEKCERCRQRTEKLRNVREWMVKRGLLDSTEGG